MSCDFEITILFFIRILPNQTWHRGHLTWYVFSRSRTHIEMLRNCNNRNHIQTSTFVRDEKCRNHTMSARVNVWQETSKGRDIGNAFETLLKPCSGNAICWANKNRICNCAFVCVRVRANWMPRRWVLECTFYDLLRESMMCFRKCRRPLI